jgi:hypothetical protein
VKITKRQLTRIIQEKKVKPTCNSLDGESTTKIRPVLPDVSLDNRLNDYIIQYASSMRAEIGESIGSHNLLEVMKEYLVEELEKGTLPDSLVGSVDH